MTIETDRVARLRERLNASLAPQQLDISDDSHKHIGHAGAGSGGGHFAVRIVAQAFKNKSLLERHRMIYDLLHDMMPSEIHALSIQARSPDELQAT